MAATIRTFTGRRLDFSAPRVEDIHLADIARGLSHCCRFAGQLPRFYSVAQHSVMVAKLVDQPMRRLALLHDASEAYMGDISRNLKHHPFLDGYRALESQLQTVILKAFNIPKPDRRSAEYRMLKAADDLAAVFEHVALRAQTRWLGLTDIEEAIATHYVSSTLDDMASMQGRLPMYCFSGHDPRTAEQEFMQVFNKEFC